MPKLRLYIPAAVIALITVTGQAQAGIPIATWAVPYVIVGAVVMFIFIGLTNLAKPKEVPFQFISSENSAPLVVSMKHLATAMGAGTMLMVAWGVVDALTSMVA